MDLTNRHFLFVMIAAAGVAAGSALSNADSQPAAAAAPASAVLAEGFVYFPAQYALAATGETSPHIQAF